MCFPFRAWVLLLDSEVPGFCYHGVLLAARTQHVAMLQPRQSVAEELQDLQF